MFDIAILISSHVFAMVLYGFLRSYNSIFTIHQRFSIGFRSGLDDGISIIFSLVNILCSKNLWVSLDKKRSILVHKYILFFQNAWLGLVPFKEIIVYKTGRISSV